MLSKFPSFKTSLLFFCIICGEIFAQWDKYPTYGEYVGYMEKWEEDYPQLAKLHDLGPAGDTSLHHRMYAIQISDSVGQNEQEPSFFYLSSLHGDELVGYVLLLRLADYLLTNYGNNELVTKLVDSIDIWIAPLCNPDGTYPRVDSTVDYAQRRNVADNFDLNRNFPCLCQQGNHKEYGLYNYAAKETEAVRKMIDSNNFVMSADLEGGGEIALYPWAFLPDSPADELWWRYVAQEYADTAQKYSPEGYFDDSGGVDQYYTAGYEVHGVFIDYPLFYLNCRNLTLRLSPAKLVPASQLNDYWNYNYRSLLNYMKQVLYGIRGIVKEELTDFPLDAKIYVEDHDDYYSHVYSHLPSGEYYRPMYQGVYDVTFSREAYITKTLYNVVVNKNIATVIDVKLEPETGIIGNNQKKHGVTISIHPFGRIVKIGFNLAKPGNTKLQVYNTKGELISTLLDSYKQGGEYTVNWNMKGLGSGVYFIKLSANGSTVSKKFTIIK